MSSLADQVKRLRDPDREVRREARRALESCGPEDRDAVPALAAAVFHRVPQVGSVVRALGRIGPDAAAAVPQLLGLLGDPRANYRAAASSALADIGPPAAGRAIPAMSRMLGWERDDLVLKQLVGDLGKFAQHSPEAIGPLKEALEHSDAEVRKNAAIALGGEAE